eukprot:snap_masked-scaffold_11-processed-gene-0.19-mRNA-1 protein AED:1.00 eAED:1.00 QI:0/-1/0/0/-1/1/1/0/63
MEAAVSSKVSYCSGVEARGFGQDILHITKKLSLTSKVHSSVPAEREQSSTMDCEEPYSTTMGL